MNITEQLIEQCREPMGFLGIVMIKIMNAVDSGLTNWALNLIDLPAGNILDIGCGGGKTVRMLSKKYPKSKIFGIDYSQDAVKASLKANKQGLDAGNIIIKQASVSSIPFPDGYFHCITAIRTHYFWPDLKRDLQEVFRVLHKGGQLLILSEAYKIQYHMKRYNTNYEMERLLKDTGFASVGIHCKNQCICIIAEK